MSTSPDPARAPAIAIEISSRRLPMRMYMGRARGGLPSRQRSDTSLLGLARTVVIGTIALPLLMLTAMRYRARQRTPIA